MSLTGTITEIFPRWLRAGEGMLFAFRVRVSAVAHTVRRVVPRVTVIPAFTVAARCIRRVIPARVKIAVAFTVAGSRVRRVVPGAVSIIASISSIARRKRRATPDRVQASVSFDLPTGARAYGPFKFATGTRIKFGAVSAKLIR